MDILSKTNVTFVLTLIVVLYIISHYLEEVCNLIGLEYKGTVT